MRHLSYMIGLFILTLGSSASGDGMSLVGQWSDHDHLYGDVWAEVIPHGPHAGTYAYLGHFFNVGGVDIIDISDPSNPTLASTFIGTGGGNEVFDVKVQNGIGYFGAEFEGGIFIVDVSNPFAPVQLARIDPSNGGFRSLHNLFVDGDYLYTVDNRTPEIRVFDVSDPANPSFLRAIPGLTVHGVHEVTVKNGRLYTASPYAQGFVAVYDIQNVGDLTAPVPLLTSFRVPGGATHSAYPTDDGQFVVVTREWLSFDAAIWDISDLAAPTLASTISVPPDEAMSAHQPAVIGNLVYFAWFEAGVRVYDIADPYNPVLVGDFDTYTGPYDEPGECAGRAGNGHGRFSDHDPYPVACGAWGIYPFLGNDRILVSDFDGGLFIVSLD